MKSSQVAVAGGVFAAVLVGCFVLLGLGSKGDTPDPTPEPITDSPPVVEEPIYPSPKPESAAAGGFGELPRKERGYDATAALTRNSSSAEAVIATWTLPIADVREFGDTYRDIRLSGERLVGVSDGGIRVLSARTGESAGEGLMVAKDFPETALSPNGDWAVQPSAAGITLLDLRTGKATKLPAASKRSFTGPAAFGADNGWCAVLGEDNGKPAVFRVRKGSGSVELVGTYRPNTDRGDASVIRQLHASKEAGRLVVERPAERSPTPRLLAWAPPGQTLLPLPAFNASGHEGVAQFRLSPDGKRAAMFDAGTLKVFDLEANRLLLTHTPEDLKLGGVAFSPDSNRLVVAYASRRTDGDVENVGIENVYLPGSAWVLDLTTKALVGTQLQFGDMGIGKGFRRIVLSTDGNRLAVFEASGKVHLVDTDRAFGGGVLSGASAAPAPAGGTPNKPEASGPAPS